MRFHAEHRFKGSTGAVMALLGDPAFYLDLVLPDLSQPELLDHGGHPVGEVVRLRYEYVGSLDPLARRLIGPKRLAWIQEVHIDRAAGTGALRVEAENDPKRLHGAADFVLAAFDGGSVRRLDGELVVAVPGVGRVAERRIVPGLLRRLDIEAGAVDDRLG